MKKPFQLLFTLAFSLILFAGVSFAQDSGSDLSDQDIKGGMVTYEQFTHFDWNYTPTGDARRDNWFANLPKSQKKAKVLYFNMDYSLYEEDLNAEGVVLDPRQQGMLDRMAMGQPPKPEVRKVHFDLKKSKKTELVELMTRLFLIENKIENQN